MSKGVIDTRNFSSSYEETRRRLRVLEQQVSNPDIQLGSSSAGSSTFDQITLENPGAGSDIILGFLSTTPTGLSALTSTYLDEVYIDVSWTSVLDAAEYEVELARRTSPGVYDQARVYRTAGTSVRMIVPLGGVVYGVRIASINSVGIRSTFTSRIDVTTAVDSTIPGTITGLSVTAAINTLVVTFNRLADSDMQNGDGIYRVQLSSNDFAAIISDKYTSSNVETFDGLTQATNYKVRVAGIDPSGNQGPYTTSTDVQVGYVTNSHLVANTISGDRITAATIQGAKIVAGSVDGDRITANTLDANRIKTSSLTAADISIAGGSLTAGSPVTADGVLLNSQGIKLYKDGQISVNLDALTGDATFTGDIVGSNIYGGYIESPEIVGSVDFSTNACPNGDFSSGITGWASDDSAGNTVISLASPPNPTVNGTDCLKIIYDGSGNLSLAAKTANFAISPFERYNFSISLKPIGFDMDNSGPENWRVNLSFFKADGLTLASYSHTATTPNQFFFPSVNNGLVSILRSTFRTPDDAAFLRIRVSMNSIGTATGGWLAMTNYVLVDDIVVAPDKGIYNIQYHAGQSNSDGIIISSDYINEEQVEDKIIFARPSDTLEADRHEYGGITFRKGQSNNVVRKHEVIINTGGYAQVANGAINRSIISMYSGEAGLGQSNALMRCTTGTFAVDAYDNINLINWGSPTTQLFLDNGLAVLASAGNSLRADTTGSMVISGSNVLLVNNSANTVYNKVLLNGVSLLWEVPWGPIAEQHSAALPTSGSGYWDIPASTGYGIANPETVTFVADRRYKISVYYRAWGIWDGGFTATDCYVEPYVNSVARGIDWGHTFHIKAADRSWSSLYCEWIVDCKSSPNAQEIAPGLNTIQPVCTPSAVATHRFWTIGSNFKIEDIGPRSR